MIEEKELEAAARQLSAKISMPKLFHLAGKGKELRDFITDFQSLATILQAYDNILSGKRGRDGLWTFEGEKVNNFKVTIRKPSPRDLPDISILDSASKNPISLSQLVIRTRDKLDLMFDGEKGLIDVNIIPEINAAFLSKHSAVETVKKALNQCTSRSRELVEEEVRLKEKIRQEEIRIEERDGECQKVMKQAKMVATLGYWILAGTLTQVFTIICCSVVAL